MPYYRWTHAVATAMATAAVSYQAIVIWDMLDALPITTKLGIPLATVSAALMPVLAEASWRAGERIKALLMMAPVVVLMAYVLPSGVSRLGEPQAARHQAAVLSTNDRDRVVADLARTNKLVAEAEAWVAAECRTGRGGRCDGVTFVLNQRRASAEKLAARLTTAQPVLTPWLPAWHPALLPIGLEMAIVGLMFYGAGPLTRLPVPAAPQLPAEVAPVTVTRRLGPKAITERDFESDPITEEEIEEIKRVLGMEGLMNKELAARLGVSEGQASKLATAAMATGKIIKRVNPANRRAVLISAA